MVRLSPVALATPFRVDIVQRRTFCDGGPFRYHLRHVWSRRSRSAAELAQLHRDTRLEVLLDAPLHEVDRSASGVLGAVDAALRAVACDVPLDGADRVPPAKRSMSAADKTKLYRRWARRLRATMQRGGVDVSTVADWPPRRLLEAASLSHQVIEHVGALFGWWRPWTLEVEGVDSTERKPPSSNFIMF